MNLKTLNVSLLSVSIVAALFPINSLAAKLTIEQRLELLENELSQNKAELKQTKNELGEYKSRLSRYKKVLLKTNIKLLHFLKYRSNLQLLTILKMKTESKVRLMALTP